MSVIIRLQNLPLTASSIDIRTFFRGLSIPDGGVHIVGGAEGDAFIAFSTDEDARQAMQLTGHKLKDSTVRLLLSSRNEMFKVIEQARVDAGQPSSPSPAPSASSSTVSLTGGPPAPTSGLPHLQSSYNNSIQENNNISRTSGAYPNTNALPNLMGTHSGIGGVNFGGISSENNNGFLSQSSHGIGIEGLGGTTITSFPGSLSSTSTAPSHLGTQQAPPISGNANSSNHNLFGMSAAAMAGMPMPFPSLMANGSNSLPLNMNNLPNMGINPAAIMNMIPPGINPQSGAPPPTLQLPQQRMMMMNHSMNGSNNNNMGNSQLPPQISFNHPPPGILGNQSRPPPPVGPLGGGGGGGYPAGLNPMFMSGGMSNGNGRMPGPHLSNIRGPGMDPNNMKDRVRAPMGNGSQGSFRLGLQARGFNDGLSRDNREKRSRSNSRERRDNSRRRNSRSRDRDRPERRRNKFSRSKSRSRSPKSSRLSGRRESRDKRSPEKGRGRRDSDPPLTPFNTTEEEHPAIKLIGIPKDASYREIRDFLRVDIMGGGDGIVRLYEEETAYVKLEKAADYPRAYRSNSRKLRGSIVNMEGITIERWVNEYKLNKIRSERDIDRDRERERHKDRDERGGSDRDRDRDKSDRGARPSRFNSASQSSCIVIRNLPPTITSRDVSARLLKDTPVTDLIVSAGPVANNGRHTAVAYIKLDSSQTAQKIIDLIVRSQEGANLVVEVCNEDDFSNAKSRTESRGMNNRMEPNMFNRDLKFGGDATSIFDLEPGLDDDSCSVMIERAPPNVSERDVFDFFSDIGLAPTSVKIMYDAQDQCSGQIVCEFPDSHKARRATTKDGMLFGRGHVKVEMMPSGRRRNPVDPSILGNKGQIRPSLLGARPIVPGMLPSRFSGIPPGPNPFIQALQNANGPRHSTPSTRGRGGPSRFGPRNDFSNSSSGRDRDDRMGGGSRGRGSGLPIELEPPVIDGPDMFGKPGCVLALENVPFKASMDDILHHLSSILNIDIAREKIIRRFDDSEKPTGDARVAFDTPAEAKLAHDRLTGTKMWNRLISYTIL